MSKEQNPERSDSSTGRIEGHEDAMKNKKPGKKFSGSRTKKSLLIN